MRLLPNPILPGDFPLESGPSTRQGKQTGNLRLILTVLSSPLTSNPPMNHVGPTSKLNPNWVSHHPCCYPWSKPLPAPSVPSTPPPAAIIPSATKPWL